MAQNQIPLKSLIDELKSKWHKCEAEHQEVFRYKLNVAKDKVIEGNFKFYVQVWEIFLKDFHEFMM